MAITLDEYLAEVDQWKQEAAQKILASSPEECAEEGRRARAWLEEKLGRRLDDAPPLAHHRLMKP